MLDTSVAILLRDGHAAAIERLARSRGTLLLSVISLVELEGGIRRDPSQAMVRRERMNGVLQSIEVLPFAERVVPIYGELVEQLGFSRPPIIDRMIAAHALQASAGIATTNVRHFSGIAGLYVEDWSSLDHPA
jgi:predicted nucleic acid-binding protein